MPSPSSFSEVEVVRREQGREAAPPPEGACGAAGGSSTTEGDGTAGGEPPAADTTAGNPHERQPDRQPEAPVEGLLRSDGYPPTDASEPALDGGGGTGTEGATKGPEEVDE